MYGSRSQNPVLNIWALFGLCRTDGKVVAGLTEFARLAEQTFLTSAGQQKEVYRKKMKARLIDATEAEAEAETAKDKKKKNKKNKKNRQKK